MSFSEFLIDSSDDEGNISFNRAQKISINHGISEEEFNQEFNEESSSINAQKFLEWMGY
jgi:hypothetical protein